jgi:potassium voltage-gated channel Eag-related subfamily H protein 7
VQAWLGRVSIEVIDPVSRFVIFWDVFHLATIILVFYWLPYKISFNTMHILNLVSINSNAMEIVLLVILASDVIVRCNMAFIQKGNIIRQRAQIVVNYVKKYAFVDFVRFVVASYV